MAPRDDDWSDSDDEELPDVETSVLLGIPDGPIEKQEDIDDAAVSRLGGYPALLPRHEPPLSSTQCKNCSSQMELLVQLWCPLENSPMDRALYVWGCARSSCQRKDGSVRAFRGLRHNEKYAQKLESKRARMEEARLRKEAEVAAAKNAELERKEKAKVNPFSMSSNVSASGMFGSTMFGSQAPPRGIGTQLFGASDQQDSDAEPDVAEEDETATHPPSSDVDENDSDGDEDSGSSDEDSQIIALTSTTSNWRSSSVPVYSPPQYLSTDTEFIPAPPKQNGSAIVEDGAHGDDKKDAGEVEKWNAAMEGYENSLDVDQVFERFVKRVSYEGEQCIRYELNGSPLPYASDDVFKSLYPLNPDSSGASRRTYNPSSPTILPCSACGSRRVFECQLMPNLINVLKTTTPKPRTQSDEERRRELERMFKANTPSGVEVEKGESGNSDVRGMEWGTCMVFSCEKDCCLVDMESAKGKEEAKECWREELVLVQWEE